MVGPIWPKEWRLVKTIVLDATEITRDWRCDGLAFVLLGHMIRQNIVTACVPASVIEEVVANHGRAVLESDLVVGNALAKRRRLALSATAFEPEILDYRAYLSERFDELLGIDVLPWPAVTHEALVARAVSRTPPFDQRGSGYRDSLVWASVMELAGQGREVALVSADFDFANKDGSLAAALVTESEETPGNVELVRNLASWLLTVVPWRASDIAEAIALARQQDFYEYFLQSDLQDDFQPGAEVFGFRRAPYEFEVTETIWGGSFDPVGAVDGPDGAVLAEYDISEIASFQAKLPGDSQVEDGWRVEGPDFRGDLIVAGEVNLVVRVAVLFDTDMGMSVEQLAWRRSDGVGAGASVSDPAHGQMELF